MRLAYIFLLPILLSVCTANAVLGEKFVAPNDPSLNYSKTQLAAFAKHETTQAKMTMREFTDSANKVFALSWSGANHPNLAQALGAQFPAFEQALTEARKTHRGHAPLQIESNGLHVEMGGSPHAVTGRIWILGGLPKGVSSNDLH
jgi:Protein of unknown function (DUF2844)